MIYIPTHHDKASKLPSFLWGEYLALLALAGLVVSGLYLALGGFAGFVARQITVADEIAMWRENQSAEDKSLWRPEPDLVLASQWVQSLLDQIPQEALGDFAVYDFRVVVVEEEAPNAFAMPGGLILVTTGMLGFAESENELVSILGHEIGHFIGRDHLESAGRGFVASGLSLLVFGADSFLSAWFATSELDFLGLKYSRQEELEADIWGVDFAVAVYGHAGGVTDFDRRLSGYDEAPATAWWFSTHPSYENRIGVMENYIAARGYSLGETLPLQQSWIAFRRRQGQDPALDQGGASQGGRASSGGN